MAAKLPIGVQDFLKLRTEGYKYIDKTGTVYCLAKSGCYYFLSRPRRFGKSLFLSTLEAYFLGRKDLFSGLEIENLEKDWVEYPVLRLDLNTQDYRTTVALSNKIDRELSLRENTVQPIQAGVFEQRGEGGLHDPLAGIPFELPL